MSPIPALSRRRFLVGASGLVLAGCAQVATRDPAVIGETALKDRAARKGLVFGAEVAPRLLRNSAYRAMLIRDAGMVVAGNALKWGPLERFRQTISFRGADTVARFAESHGMAMRGHTFLWHRMVPSWLPGALRDEAEDPARLLAGHIRAVGERYRGRMHSWDVVNEAIEPDDGRPDGLRNSLFLQALGPAYLELAFRTAAEADPHARLVFNDYGQEWGWDVGRRRRDATLRVLENLLKKDVPLHAVGIQGHLDPGVDGAMDMHSLGRFCDEVAELGLTIQVTELDARDTSIGGGIARRDRLVADAYARFLETVLARPATKAVITWGITDRHSWLTRHFPRPDGDTVRGLPYDADFTRKPAWYALAAALDAAPKRAPSPTL